MANCAITIADPRMKRIDETLFDTLRQRTAASPRRRSNLNWHDPERDGVQRFFLHMAPGTYVRPHRHRQQQRWELVAVLGGCADLLFFDDGGTVRAIHALGAGGLHGVEIPWDAWHSYRVTGEELILLEIKEGPYTASQDKDFAAWAPAEDSTDASDFLAWLNAARIGERYCA